MMAATAAVTIASVTGGVDRSGASESKDTWRTEQLSLQKKSPPIIPAPEAAPGKTNPPR